MKKLLKRNVGAQLTETGVEVILWAPKATNVSILWDEEEKQPLTRDDEGYHKGFFDHVKEGARYQFHVHDCDKIIPDPASRFQPEDVFCPSQVCGEDFSWKDSAWRGIPFDEWVIYEVHTGTFSSSHDFSGIIDDLPRLKELGVNVIELMPVAQFSGNRNWGYDAVFPFAVQYSYGGPKALKELVNACHMQGMSIILDVVYNHFGPEGNVFDLCGPYTKQDSSLPWGHPLNFDDKGSDHVRHFFLQNVQQWLLEFHFDGLRLDAVDAIQDSSAMPFLEEVLILAKEVETLRGYPLPILAETSANDPRCLNVKNQPGFYAQWSDDFHHALHATLTGERNGYYADYGGLAQLAHIYRRGVLFEGQYSANWGRRHGRSYENVPHKNLIVFSQNHDQIGNRNDGARLATLIGQKKARLAAAAVLLSPFTPLLFMGEEWGSTKPFNYFLSFEDKELIKDSKKGRRQEWASFHWAEPPPDPVAAETFFQSVLANKAQMCKENADMVSYYRQLVGLSKRIRRQTNMKVVHVAEDDLIWIYYTLPDQSLAVCLSFADKLKTLKPEGGPWQVLLGTERTIDAYAACVLQGGKSL